MSERPSLLERTWDPKWTVVRSRRGSHWLACRPGRTGPGVAHDTHAEAIAYATAQARKES